MDNTITLGYLTTGSHIGQSKVLRAKLIANSVGPELYYIIASSGHGRKPHLIQRGDIFTIDKPRSPNNGDIIHFITPYHVEYSDRLGNVFGSHEIATEDSQELDRKIEEMYKKRQEKIETTKKRRDGKRASKQ